MPALSPQQLTEAFLDAFNESGCAAVLLSSTRQHPRRFLISLPNDEPCEVWVYAWTLTPGGRPQLKDEFRIQMTSVSSPLGANPSGDTAIMGYEPDIKTFAGFDLNRHKIFTTGSPSVQIAKSALHEALQNGLAFHRKSNSEIAIGVRADQLVNYILNSESFHRHGKDAQVAEFLRRATSLSPISDKDLMTLSQPRKRLIQTAARLSRAANFKKQILGAYDNRCAVTRLQLRLVDAAHIHPVGAPGSIDHVRNGLALSPTIHRAYDNRLIYLDEEYNIRVNPEKEAQLKNLNLDAGLSAFKSMLGKIHLPHDKRQWPDPEWIKKANRFRQIPL